MTYTYTHTYIYIYIYIHTQLKHRFLILIAAVVSDKILCVHGGISPEWEALEDLTVVRLIIIIFLNFILTSVFTII